MSESLWPEDIPTPDSPGWQEAAAEWLGRQLPPYLTADPYLGGSPVLTAWLGRHHLYGQIQGVRESHATARIRLASLAGPALGLELALIDRVLEPLAEEADRLSRLERQVWAVDDALAAARWGTHRLPPERDGGGGAAGAGGV
ncbi:hypothetical protein [Phaeacidiphilus oryzae]|uniref:hypothetical protein n=1 Tax=Phaeacidiphilus oryzae TaxID=348818 RepID=UPI00056006BB|nr:hypothetical protein [Phaeacidiphilus oryzae]